MSYYFILINIFISIYIFNFFKNNNGLRELYIFIGINREFLFFFKNNNGLRELYIFIEINKDFLFFF